MGSYQLTSIHLKKGNMTSIDSLILDFHQNQREKMMTIKILQRKHLTQSICKIWGNSICPKRESILILNFSQELYKSISKNMVLTKTLRKYWSFRMKSIRSKVRISSSILFRVLILILHLWLSPWKKFRKWNITIKRSLFQKRNIFLRRVAN